MQKVSTFIKENKKIAAITAGSAAVAGIALVAYKSSIFYSPKRLIRSFPEMNVVYYKFTGDYKKAWKHFPAFIGAIREKYGVDFERKPSFGIYYDDPANTPVNERRSIIGVVLSEETKIELKDEGNIFLGKIEAIENGISFDTISRSYCGMMIQIGKCYSAIAKESQCKTPPIEIYGFDAPNNFSVVIGTQEASEGLLAKYPE